MSTHKQPYQPVLCGTCGGEHVARVGEARWCSQCGAVRSVEGGWTSPVAWDRAHPPASRHGGGLG